MIPLKIHIQGIGPHRDTIVDFRGGSPLAIEAEYGSGKTFLVESIFAALYGRFAWYAGSIRDAMTQGGTGDGLIDLVFSHEGQVYRAVRTLRDTGATFTHRAELFNQDGDLLFGPKIGDFDNGVVAMIGEAETSLATWFLSQNRRGDLCGLPGEADLVARRRSVFHELLGVDQLASIETLVAGEQSTAAGAIRELEAQLKGEGDLDEDIRTLRQSADMLGGQIELADAAVAAAEAALEQVRGQLRDTQGGEDVLKAQIDAHEQAEIAEDLAGAALEGERSTVASLGIRAQGLERAQCEVATLNEQMARREELREAQRLHEAWLTWQREGQRLERELAAGRQRVRDLEAMPGVDDATRDLAGRAPEIKARGVAAREANERAAAANEARSLERNRISLELAGFQQELESVNRRLASAPVTPFGDQCSPCPLMREWAELPSRSQIAELAIKARQHELEIMPPDDPIADLTELRAEYEQAMAAVRQIVDLADAIQRHKDAMAEARAAEAALELHNQAAVAQADDPREELVANQRLIDSLAGAPERLAQAQDAQQRLGQANTRLEAARAASDAARARAEALRPAAESARQALEDRRARWHELADAADRAAEDVRLTSQSARTWRDDLARVNARIDELTRRQQEQAARRERLAVLTDRAAGLQDLRECFGPRGVRQILIDDAAPQLEAIADGLFAEATGGRMRLRLATQQALRDGSIAEAFSIMVQDERGERDALRYSGGQLQLIQILLRIAVAIWLGRLRNQRPECLVIDEAFDRLGAEGTDDLLRVLDGLKDELQQIIVVTHDRLIDERLPARLRLQRQMSGVIVTAEGQGVAA